MNENASKPLEPDGRPARSRRHAILRHALRLAAFCAVLAVWRVTSKFPASWEQRISKALSSEDFSVKVAGVSFSFPQLRLTVNSIALYPQQEDCRMALSISSAEIRIRPRSLVPALDWIRDVRLGSLEFDADALASLSGDSDEDGDVIPEIAPIQFSIRRVSGVGMELCDLRGIVSSAGGAISIDDASVSFHGRGEPRQTLRGHICVEPSAPAVEAIGSGFLDFSKLTPALRELDCPGIAEELEKFEFPARPPRMDIVFYWAPSRQARSLVISMESGPMRYSGVQLTELYSDIRVGGSESWDHVDINPLKLHRPEGLAAGSFSIDIGANTLSFDYTSSLNPLILAAVAGLISPSDFPDIEIESPSDIRCQGIMGLDEDDDARNSVRVSASIPSVTARGFCFSNIVISGSVDGAVINFPNINAKAMDGSLEASCKISGGGDERTVSASLALRNVPQSQWARLIEREADAKAGGTLDMNATFDGPLDELVDGIPKRGHGTFSADIRKAVLFRIPLFLGLTDILARFIPGVNFLVDEDTAHVQATFDDGRWKLSNFSISGTAFTIDGSGTAAADGSDIDIVARVRLMNKYTWIGRLVQRLFSPLSGLLGVRASGSIDAPRWTMAPFSRSPAK